METCRKLLSFWSNNKICTKVEVIRTPSTTKVGVKILSNLLVPRVKVTSDPYSATARHRH